MTYYKLNYKWKWSSLSFIAGYDHIEFIIMLGIPYISINFLLNHLPTYSNQSILIIIIITMQSPMHHKYMRNTITKSPIGIWWLKWIFTTIKYVKVLNMGKFVECWFNSIPKSKKKWLISFSLQNISPFFYYQLLFFILYFAHT